MDQDNSKNSGPLKKWTLAILTHVFLPTLIAFITSFFIQPWASQYWGTPDINILGLLPIRFTEDGEYLAFIIKIKNSSLSPITIYPAVNIEGCVKMNEKSLAEIAEMGIPPQERVSFIGNESAVRRHKYTVQRIFISASIRDAASGISVPAYGIEYIGAFFVLEPFDVRYEFIGSVALNGNCSEIKVRNTRPTHYQFFDPLSWDPKLRDEFFSGGLSISFFASGKKTTLILDSRVVEFEYGVH